MPAQDVLDAARRLWAQGEKPSALECLRSHVRASKVPAELLFDWGRLLGDAAGAQECWIERMRVEPIDPRAANDLAVARLKAQDMPGALRLAEQALSAAPDFVPALINLGIIRAMLGDQPAALAAFTHVLTLEPENLDALRNLVSLHGERGEPDEASRLLSTYLRLAPRDPDALYLQGIEQLRSGALAQGWQGYEQRWSRLGPPRRLKGVPVWLGEPLSGKRLLVIDEQGIGEQVLFASCIPRLVGLGATVTLRCAAKLKQLFEASFAGVAVMAAGIDDNRLAPANFDFQVALGSLPQHFWKSHGPDVRTGAVLQAPADLRTLWRHRLHGLGPGLKVGISWRGGSNQTGAKLRSIALEHWRAVLAVPGVSFVNLQYTDCADEVADIEQRFGCKLHTWPEALGDYAHTAALVGELDLVVSVATALARLCSALGKEVWVLVPVAADWIYQREGPTTPWLPSARLFRQDRPLQWEQVLDRVQAELHVRVRGQ
jgi:tetratricopeptide (TPR) repeat protein